jgi:hypothetical protein
MPVSCLTCPQVYVTRCQLYTPPACLPPVTLQEKGIVWVASTCDLYTSALLTKLAVHLLLQVVISITQDLIGSVHALQHLPASLQSLVAALLRPVTFQPGMCS